MKNRTLAFSDLEIKIGKRNLLRRTDLQFDPGKITVIVGASGAGKSVLLRVMAGLLPRDGDAISWSGTPLVGDDVSTPPKIGIVFQQFALFDELTPQANVQFAIDHRWQASQSEEQTRLTARQWLDRLEVPASTPTSALSGGQKQRLAIARTLASEPDVVLYDEPTSGLDESTGQNVARLLQTTHESYGRTSVIVTHDYHTMIPIADHVWMLDSETGTLVDVTGQELTKIIGQVHSVRLTTSGGEAVERVTLGQRLDRWLVGSGKFALAVARLPWELRPVVPSLSWALRFFWHYLRLVGGFSAGVYLLIAGLIAGFTTTYFTFRFLPFRLYTEPLLIDELLSSIGFALYRILVPILATVLIAARCGAAVAADVGVKRYGGAIDAMATFGVPPRAYLLLPIVAAFAVATPWLEFLAFGAARWISSMAFVASHPELSEYFWRQHFGQNIESPGDWFHRGFGWVLGKNLACGIASGIIGYYRGAAPKHSARDVSQAITSTVLWSTLCVLLIHFVVALYEF